MQQLVLLFCKYDLTYISTQHVQYHFTATTINNPVDLTVTVITVESHRVQNKTFRTIYYGVFILERSNSFLMCKFK